jgi:hypothetical protein
MRSALGGEAAGTGSLSIERAEAALRAHPSRRRSHLTAGLAEVIDEFQDAPTKPRDEDKDGDDADIDHCGPPLATPRCLGPDGGNTRCSYAYCIGAPPQ